MQRIDDEEDVSASELREKLKQYTTFVDSTLYPQLKKTVEAREETEGEIQEYSELHNKLQVIIQSDISKPMEAMVNLGHELVYCRAVADRSTVCVDIGKGFFVELTIQEAMPVIMERITFLRDQVLKKRIEDASRVASHLESSLVIVEALSKHVKELAVQE